MQFLLGNTLPDVSALPVLLVEDDPAFQETFARVFTQMGGDWKIHPFMDGASALRAVAEPGRRFELALIDIGLPDMSGIDVIAALRGRYADLPILVTTVFSAEETFLSAIRAGARGYLLKSDTELSLLRSIDQVMLGQYPFSPALARHLFRLAGSPSMRPVENSLKLSPRELELLQLISRGHSYVSCAEAMKISVSTVQTHIRNMYRKLEVCNQRQAITKAQSSGLLNP
jgi:two-component system nitrate/nitrite response regulator NarL